MKGWYNRETQEVEFRLTIGEFTSVYHSLTERNVDALLRIVPNWMDSPVNKFRLKMREVFSGIGGEIPEQREPQDIHREIYAHLACLPSTGRTACCGKLPSEIEYPDIVDVDHRAWIYGVTVCPEKGWENT